MSPWELFFSKPPQGPWSRGNTQGFRKNNMSTETTAWFVSKMKTSSRMAPVEGLGMSLVGMIVHPQGNGNFHPIGDLQLQNAMGTGIYKLNRLITKTARYVFGVRSAEKKSLRHQVFEPSSTETRSVFGIWKFSEVSDCLRIG